MNQLQDYFNLLKTAIYAINSTITGLNLYFLGVRLNLLSIFGASLMTAIIAAILYPSKTEYDDLGE